jgi:hypothetical protein
LRAFHVVMHPEKSFSDIAEMFRGAEQPICSPYADAQEVRAQIQFTLCFTDLILRQVYNPLLERWKAAMKALGANMD